MGEVYLARDLMLERDVAIKLLPAGQGGDDGARKRALREAQLAAALDHPNICATYEVGETPDGRGFIVMQHIEGETLGATLRRGPLSERDALSLCAQIAEALAVAHKRSIVHRDLKPQNVMVTPSGRPKLLDFGLAKVLAATPWSEDSPTNTAETAAGIIKGTPGYMSPEQVRQDPLDGRSDLFALGAVLFECLTGRQAFHGANNVETFGQILHVHPPAVSHLRPSLTEAHDELCRRLLAKDPADRFQSAEQVLGALRLLLSDTTRDRGKVEEAWPPRVSGAKASPSLVSELLSLTGSTTRWGSSSPRAAIVLALVAVSVAGSFYWATSRRLPRIPAEAERWYQRGVEGIREGAYHSGQVALQEAIRVFPEYALAHARLAETWAEMDDERAAQEELLRVSSLLPDESRLPQAELLRLEGIRALVLRDMDPSIAAYRRLVEREAQDATAWVDLGRAQESAGLRADARASYERAVSLDRGFAAAHLRLACTLAQELRRDEALSAFEESGRVYQAAANLEGETEVLIQRGKFYDAIGEIGKARTDLERALQIALPLKGTHQIVRTRLALSSVTASEGNFSEAEKLTSAGVQEALNAGLDTVAADGLVDLAATLMQATRLREADTQVQLALQMAQRRGARLTTARAKLQLASLRLQQNRPQEAMATAVEAVAFFKARRYRRYELVGLSIMSRAEQAQDEIDRARVISAEVLAAAESLKDDDQVGIALSTLASLAMAVGQFPEALAYRERSEDMRRERKDVSTLPYDLANRADLLIRLGRFPEASRALNELDAGIKAGIDVFVGRARRATFLRGLAAVVASRFEEAERILASVEPSSDGGESAAVLGPVLLEYARARLGRAARRPGAAPGIAVEAMAPVLRRERQYWLAATALARGQARDALTEAERGLEMEGDASNDERRWRLAANGAIAAQIQGDAARARELRRRATEAFERLRKSWGPDLQDYERRPDLLELKARTAWN
jgi:tetratricopeptide (TPR) repeat protein